MSLSVSVDGGTPIPADGVVLYNHGVPIAAAKKHGNVIIYADAARDPRELEDILALFGIRNITLPKLSELVITGKQ